MFFKSILKLFKNSQEPLINTNYSNIDQGLVRYFRTEYGQDWRAALEHHLYKESKKNDKKAA